MRLISMYAQDMLTYVLIALPVWLVIRIAYLKLRRTRIVWRRELVIGMSALYAVGLLSQTALPPGHYGLEDGALYAQPMIGLEKQYNLVPLSTIAAYAFETNDQVSDWGQVSNLNLLGNIALFAPFGFLVPQLRFKDPKLWRVLVLGVATSVMIEVLQFFFGRSADVDDVILNGVGVCIGWFVLTMCMKFAPSRSTGSSCPEECDN